MHCRRVLVGCPVGGCEHKMVYRYIHSIQVYTPLLLPQGNGTGGKVNIRAYGLDGYKKHEFSTVRVQFSRHSRSYPYLRTL